ncbi:MAG: TetR/AcrR family transcriptional regulator [Chloroflexi bacterium]|nr:TetR/AcrR family transcriptional regulator [Chloroflexota bacterium]
MSLKDNIVHEAQKLFSLNGFLNTGINDIIAAAGTSKGGFYNHFASKEDLFYAVLSESQAIWRDKVLYSIDEIESPTVKIIKILKNYRDRYLKDSENFPGGCIFITFSVELDDTRPQLMKEVNKGFEGFKALLTRLLDEAIELGELPKDINSDSVAETLFAGMLGASVLYGVDKDNLILDRSIDSLIEYVILLSNKQMPNKVLHSEST